MRGTPRKPSAMLELSGIAHKKQKLFSEQKRNMDNNGVILTKEEIPLPPRGTSKEGKEFFNLITSSLIGMGVLALQDLPQLYALLDLYEAYLLSLKELKKWDREEHSQTKENISARKNLVQTMTTCFASFNRLAGLFGLTPSERTRLCAPPKEHEEEDPLDMLGV